MLQCAVGTKLTGFVFCANCNSVFSKYFDLAVDLITGRHTRRNLGRSLNELVEALYPIQQSIALGIEVLGNEMWVS